LTEVALLWTELKERGVFASRALRALAKLEGVYVPSLYATKVDADTGWKWSTDRSRGSPFPVKRTIVENLNDWPFPDDGRWRAEAIFDRISIEIARAARGVPLLQAGMIYRPRARTRSDEIAKTVARAVRKTGSDEVSLTSLSTADYSCISPLIHKVAKELAPQKSRSACRRFAPTASKRTCSTTCKRARHRVTFAPEAGSQGSRLVNKNVTEEQLHAKPPSAYSRAAGRA